MKELSQVGCGHSHCFGSVCSVSKVRQGGWPQMTPVLSTDESTLV